MTQKLLAVLLAVCLLAALPGCRKDDPADGNTQFPGAENAGGTDVSVPDIPAEPDDPPEPEPPAPTTATLAVCGDAMSHMPLTNDTWDDDMQDYDYTRVMAAARPLVSAADYAVVNLETTLAGGPPYSGYPRFNSPDGLAYSLSDVGFDLCMTSNNHCMDTGIEGLTRTLDVLDEVGLAHVGTSRSPEEAGGNMVLADVGGITVAFLGYTYGTNGLPLPKGREYAVNLFNTDYLTSISTPDKPRLEADLAAAKALEPDLIAVMIHWGIEYQTKQNGYQEELADFLFANGADIVLGGHPHVLQPMALRTLDDGRQGFVCYSLGNFISAQNDPLTDLTAVLTLELTRDNVTGETQVTGYEYAPMYMLDREEGASPRYELLDIHAALAAGVSDAGLEQRLRQAEEDCHAILDPEHDVSAKDVAETHALK